MAKLNFTRVLLAIVDADEQEIISLLKSLSTFSTGGPPGMMKTEYITGDGPRQRINAFQKAEKVGITGLLRQKAFEIVNEDEIPHDANILGARIVLALKNVGAPNESCKARFIAQGHTYRHENVLVDTSVNI